MSANNEARIPIPGTPLPAFFKAELDPVMRSMDMQRQLTENQNRIIDMQMQHLESQRKLLVRIHDKIHNQAEMMNTMQQQLAAQANQISFLVSQLAMLRPRECDGGWHSGRW